MAEAKKSAAKSLKTAAKKAPAKSAAKKSVAKKAAMPKGEPTYQEIADLAHKYWVERGGHHGSDREDWIRAEKELRGE